LDGLEQRMQPQERWQLRDHGAEAYERYLVPALFTPWARDLLARISLRPQDRVLDVACGTGIVLRLAAHQIGSTGRVMGIDLNRGMLEIASAHAPSGGATEYWLQGDVEALPLADGTFDVVCCQQSVQFFSDKARALQEMRRVLVPGGRFALNVARSLVHNPYMRAFADALEHHVGPHAGRSMRAPCSFGDANALRTLLVQAGFKDIRIHIVIKTIRHASLGEFIPGQLAATPVAADIAALNDTARTALLNEIQLTLQPYTDDDGLAVPYEIHVATATP
jgi:ubiquinone/menaquinone biosynthesis C-methylase UbiE